MRCIIGGACSGRRGLVAERYPEAAWHRLMADDASPAWVDKLSPGRTWVVTGWTSWLEARIVETHDDEAVRTAWRECLSALGEWEREAQGEALLILDEMGGGIVPMAAEARRLRDLNGWLAQEVAARSRSVWQVRHGLCKILK